MRETFGLSPTRYFQKLIRLVGRPDVVAEFPAVSRRVQERIRRQTAARAARTFVG